MMGKVIATLTITNRADQIRAEDGNIPANAIRSVTVEDALVDTGATMLCLPKQIVERLGLATKEEVEVITANGLAKARICHDAMLSVGGRGGLFDCLELPGGSTVLLGVVPMEVLGLEPDRKNQRLRLLPMNESESYLTIL